MATFNVNALPNYVEQHREELIAEAVISAKSADLFTLQTGIKGPTALNLIDTEVVFGDGASCGWNDAGETSLSQRILTPKALKVNMSICDKYLLSKWANYLVRVAANKTDADMPFEQEFIEGVIKQVKAKIEKMIYQGNPAENDPETGEAIDPNQFEGLITILTASGESTITTTAASSVSAYAFLKQVAARIPAAVLEKEDKVILVSAPMYNAFMQDLVSANLYHYNPGDGANEYLLPGTDIKVIAVNGLNDTETYDYAIAGSLSNMFYGVDLQGGEEVFDLWYSKDNREFRFAIEFVAGVQVAYPQEIVLGKRAK